MKNLNEIKNTISKNTTKNKMALINKLVLKNIKGGSGNYVGCPPRH